MVTKRGKNIILIMIIVSLFSFIYSFSIYHSDFTTFAIFGSLEQKDFSFYFKDQDGNDLTGVEYELYNQTIEGDRGQLISNGLSTTSILTMNIDVANHSLYSYKACFYPASIPIEKDIISLLPGTDIYITKKFSPCGSKILSITNQNKKVNNPIAIKTNINSAFQKGTGLASFVPQSKEDYYKSEINVTFYVNGTLTSSKIANIPIDESQEVNFTFTPTAIGNYNITIGTLPIDCQCSSSLSNSSSITISVESLDMDNDTYLDEDYGGNDCDDNDKDINPGANETCNNHDDNCDGDKDENLTRLCQDFTAGACATGVQACSRGDWLECTGKKAELCNNIDDDCDG